MLERQQIFLAKGITLIFNAPVLAVLTYLILFTYTTPQPSLTTTITASFFVGVLPVLIIFAMVRGKIITDMLVNERKDRFKPFLAVVTCYTMGLMVLIQMRAPYVMVALMACYLINGFVMMMISRSWKISIHASGIAGPATFLTHFFNISMWPFLVLSFIICWSRWRLNMHSLNQLIAGLVVTVILTYLQLEAYPLFIPQLLSGI